MKIFLTNKCNLNCVYCFKDKGKQEPKLEEIMRRINQARKRVIFTGGEPLFRRDILKILSYAKSKGLKIGLETNGILLNTRIMKFVDELYLILDIINFKHWKKITRKSRKEFNKSVEAIELAEIEDKEVYIDSLLTKLNIKSLEETKRFCDKNNLRSRIIESPIVNRFKYSNSISLPIEKSRFLGDKNIIYLKAKKSLLNQQKLEYYKKETEKGGSERWRQ